MAWAGAGGVGTAVVRKGGCGQRSVSLLGEGLFHRPLPRTPLLAAALGLSCAAPLGPPEAPVLPAHHVVTVPCLSCSLDRVSVTIVCLACSTGEGFIQDLLSD